MLLFTICPAIAQTSAPAGVRVQTLRVEYLKNPLGLDHERPRLYWQLSGSRRGLRQNAYQIQVASSLERLRYGHADVWDSGLVKSDQSVHVPYRGPAPQSMAGYHWRVRVWDELGNATRWSDPAHWEMGLLRPIDWKARWIGLPIDPKVMQAESLDGAKWVWYPEGNPRQDAPSETRYFRRTFSVAGQTVTSATLVASADNSFTAFVNGRRVGNGDNFKSPGRFSVKDAIMPGDNVVAFAARNAGGPAALAARLIVGFANGTSTTIETDEQMRCSKTADRGWQTTGFNDSRWTTAVALARVGEPPWGAMENAGAPAQPAPFLRKEFHLRKPIRDARVFVTALGSYRVKINGWRVGEEVLTPDWTDYRKRVSYQTYNVTCLLQKGANAIGAVVGDGWYASGLGWGLQRHCFGPPPLRLFLQLLVRYQDGTSETVCSDSSWKGTSSGPILQSEIYGGETYDARKEMPGWSMPGYDDANWQRVAELPPATPLQVTAQISPPIRITKTLPPRSLASPKPGMYVVDMGQNMVGWMRLRVNGPPGTTVKMRFAEILNLDGTIYRDNLRRAEATDVYTCRGGGEEVYEPHFTYHGFRYVEITGYPGELSPKSAIGCVVHTDAPESGWLLTSSPLVNKLVENIMWGQRGNLHSVPTDCPQRDERLGWMGDANVFWRTACFNMNMAPFTHKWMRDVVDAQSSEGGFSDVSPRIIDLADGAPAWGDAGIVVPWTVYRMYGDTKIIGDNWGAMEKWMNYIHSANPDLIWNKRRNNDFGDWVPAESSTPKDVIATAYWAYDAQLMAEMADAIGKPADAKRFRDLNAGIKAAFNSKFVKGDGQVGNGSQTCYALALYMNLLPDDMRTKAAGHLMSDVARRNDHLSTGFLGTEYLLPSLSDTRNNATAYRLLLNESYPSWGYMIAKGATTIWERWNGDRGDPGMNSFNHYAFGSVGQWLYRYLAGIDTDPASPGFKKIIIRPHPGKGLTRARAQYDSLYGPIVSSWEVKDGAFYLTIVIPANTSARVHVPTSDVESVSEGTRPAADSPGVKSVGIADGHAVFEVGAGTYRFMAR